jgi:nucleoside-diphosphate kinase
MSNQTFAMIKPDGVCAQYTGMIIELIEKNGFSINRLEKKTLSSNEVSEFYSMHRERPFFGELVEYISSGPVILLALEKENAVNDWRQLIGATNPAEAAVGTIRRMFAESIGRNTVHGSDSDESAQRELSFFFGDHTSA